MKLRACLVLLLALCAAVAAWPDPPPLFTCEVNPTQGTAPLTVETSTTSRAPVTWTFGDGAAATGRKVRHTYTRVGRFEVLARGAEVGWTGTVAVRLEKRVSVGPSGGAAQVVFEGRKGHVLRIRLSGATGMEPYAHVESAAGAAYADANGRVDGGRGTWQAPLADDSRHEVTVFDGANLGGVVDVVIEEP